MFEKEFLHEVMLVRRSGLTNMFDKRNVAEILKGWHLKSYSTQVAQMSFGKYAELLNAMAEYEQNYIKEHENNGKEN